jgi:Colicin V production protein.
MLIDAVVGILIIVICWRSFRQGFARQTIQLAGLGLGICAAEPAALALSPWAEKNFKSVPHALQGPLLALAALFVVWLVVSTIGSWMLAAYRRRVHGENVPSLGDNVFGVGVGAVKSAFLVSLLVYGFEQLPESFRTLAPVDEQVRTSKGVAIAREFHLIERVVAIGEVQAIGKRMQELVEYFRKTDPSNPSNDDPTKSINQISSLELPEPK